ncbi:MAG: efflux RND transporter periplasmic adaptor subunit [Candidatus Palauibacterales bacterium]|nr:efflux RND transporter periplasmic adaptor subunit [Candidatus Palauibacterales bacterium]
MSRGIRLAGAVAILAAALGGIWLLREGGGGDATSAVDSVRRQAAEVAGDGENGAAAAIPVEGAPVRRDTFVLWVTARGETSARQAATVSTRLQGEVESVPAGEGQSVERGEVLVRLDSTEVRLDLEEARATLEEARAQFRSMTLTDGELTSDSLRRQRREQARVRSGLASARVELERQRSRLEATRIRAPIDGQVASVSVSPGDRVASGDSLLSVVDLSRARVDVRVLESELPAVEVGRQAEARIAAYPGRTFPGRVVSVNPVVDAGKNTARVTVSLQNPRARIVPGMHASVRIAGRLHEGRTFVPQEAIVERDRREVVFVFAPSDSGSAVGRARWRYVSTGLENDRYVEIVPGEETETLEPGEVVLTEGHTTLAHDARVRLRNADSLDAGQGGGR